jgi:cytochrome b
MSATSKSSASGGISPPEAADPAGTARTILVWDPLVRLFHWSLVASFAVAWATGDELERLHELAGYVIVGLVGFRIIWGIIGTRHARFSDFVYRPSAVAGNLADILRQRAERYLGHSPAGGAMAVALILVLSVTTATGILMTDARFGAAEWLEEAHELAANLALILVGLHLAGVGVASFQHRENLVKAMITGRKRRSDQDF